MHLYAELTAAFWKLEPFGEIGANFSLQLSSRTYESLEGPLLKKENIFYLVITRKLTRNNEITNSL